MIDVTVTTADDLVVLTELEKVRRGERRATWIRIVRFRAEGKFPLRRWELAKADAAILADPLEGAIFVHVVADHRDVALTVSRLPIRTLVRTASREHEREHRDAQEQDDVSVATTHRSRCRR